MCKRADEPIPGKPKPYDKRKGWITTDEGVLELVCSCGPILQTSLVDLLDTGDREEEEEEDEFNFGRFIENDDE